MFQNSQAFHGVFYAFCNFSSTPFYFCKEMQAFTDFSG